MFCRFELLTLSAGRCKLRYCDATDCVLMSSNLLGDVAAGERTITWLRSAVHKDWLYRIGREQRGGGPTFQLHAPLGVVCNSRTFSSSDALERAVDELKRAVPHAPLVLCPSCADTA